MKLIIVRNILKHLCVYINIDKIISIERKPVLIVDGVEKQALASINMDNGDTIYIDETAEDLFKRMIIGIGCININTDLLSAETKHNEKDKIDKQSSDLDNINDIPPILNMRLE